MMKLIVAVFVAIAGVGNARAADPAQVQDPPGSVDVHQPADVALDERDTESDETDTLHGSRTEVIEGAPEGAEPSERQWRNVEPGADARASFDEPADVAPAAAEPGSDTMPGTVQSDDTWIGTDLGYGVGTEPVLTPLR